MHRFFHGPASQVLHAPCLWRTEPTHEPETLDHRKEISMKAASTLTLSALLCTTGLLAHEPAMALTTVPSTICEPQGTATPPLLSRHSIGLYNTHTAPVTVLCPVVRTVEPGPEGYQAFVNGRVPDGLELSCTFVSHRHDSYTLGAAEFVTVEGPTLGGIVRQRAVLKREDVPAGSYQTVRCSIPAGGKLFGIELVQ